MSLDEEDLSLEEQDLSLEEEEVSEQVEDEQVEVEDDHSDGSGEGEGEQGEGSELGVEEYTGATGTYIATVVNDEIFEELRLPSDVAEEVIEVWRLFLSSAESRESAGEALYAALFDSAPSLQGLFKTPRAVMAMRFINGFSQIINSLDDPKGLKVVVEMFGFQHLDLEVTVPRVMIFRDAIMDLMQVEMGDRFGAKAKDGFATFLNYVGGSFIYVRVKFSERLKIITKSWAIAAKKGLREMTDSAEGAEGDEVDPEGVEGATTGDQGHGSFEKPGGLSKGKQAEEQKKKRAQKGWGFSSMTKSGSGSGSRGSSDESDGKGFSNTTVPTTYGEMFLFNAAVMGFGASNWMSEVLASFDTIVSNVANSYRLQEECDVLSLRMSKYKGTIKLGEYRSVMLASLRSLVKDWGSQHEVAWSWLWENVARMIKATMGKPAYQERALARFFNSLDETSMGIWRRDVFARFFALAPAGQDFFKQSTTRLHFIADKLVAMTLDMYKEPRRMVEELSALGLRHVGYGIPTDLFGPFVTACVQVIRQITDNDAAEEAFRWSMSLISRILMRVINEGSTIVMKAINQNSGKQLKKAVGCAPRGKRALWMLNVQVGTQSISPLMWAIETGSLDAAKGIIVDLLTMRADRDRYYYGMDILFERHPNIVNRLCLDAPALIPTLLDGLIWRSRTTESGQRRTNYYIQHMLMDAEGDFSKNTEWLTANNDPKVVCHPIVALVTDMVWGRVAIRSFMYGKAWFLFTLIIFVLSQSVLNHIETGDHGAESATSTATSSAAHRLRSSNATNTTDAATAAAPSAATAGTAVVGQVELRIAIFVCRTFIYIFSMGSWIFFHAKSIARDVRNNRVSRIGRCAIPDYLCFWQGWSSLLLVMFLVTMLCLEPILQCLQTNEGLIFNERCAEGEHMLFPYSVASTAAMLMYFLLLSDLSVFSTRVSAFALMCSRVVSEVGLFLLGLAYFVLTFACAISALEQKDPDFAGIPIATVQLYKIALGMFAGTHYDTLEEFPIVMLAIILYIVVTVIFMLNLLIAQLNCAYQATNLDMLGYARLNRGKIVVEVMPTVAKWRWQRFLASLRLDERCEFGEGDVGLSGGIQVWEPASANITTVDMIQRFGGSTSPGAQWPEQEGGGEDEVDRFDRMERLIEKVMKRMSSSKAGGKGSKLGSSMGNSAGSEATGSGDLSGSA